MTLYRFGDRQGSLRQPLVIFAPDAMVSAAVSHDAPRWCSSGKVLPVCGMESHMVRARNTRDGTQLGGCGDMRSSTVAGHRESRVSATLEGAGAVQKMLFAREPGLSWTKL